VGHGRIVGIGCSLDEVKGVGEGKSQEIPFVVGDFQPGVFQAGQLVFFGGF